MSRFIILNNLRRDFLAVSKKGNAVEREGYRFRWINSKKLRTRFMNSMLNITTASWLEQVNSKVQFLANIGINWCSNKSASLLKSSFLDFI